MMMKKYSKNSNGFTPRRSSKAGFTLVEALVAILVLSMGLIPALTSIVLANSFGSTIKNNLIASGLAQEGAEVVRAIRDANLFVDAPFDRYLADCGQPTCELRVDYNSVTPLSLDANPPLRFDSTTGLYSYSTGDETTFRRRISISRVGTCSCEILVIIDMTWVNKGITKTLTVESHLYDWR